jgi:hypothetical protein
MGIAYAEPTNAPGGHAGSSKVVVVVVGFFFFFFFFGSVQYSSSMRAAAGPSLGGVKVRVIFIFFSPLLLSLIIFKTGNCVERNIVH